MEMQEEARFLIAVAKLSDPTLEPDDQPFEAIAPHLPADPARLAILMRTTAHLLVPDERRWAECVIQIALQREGLWVGSRRAGSRPQDYYLPRRVLALRVPKHGG
jgi:hypothetical protein